MAREKRRVEERKREGSMAERVGQVVSEGPLAAGGRMSTMRERSQTVTTTSTVASWVPAGGSHVGVDIRSRLRLAF